MRRKDLRSVAAVVAVLAALELAARYGGGGPPEGFTCPECGGPAYLHVCEYCGGDGLTHCFCEGAGEWLVCEGDCL